MSFLVAPPGHHNGDTPEGGEVDQLLRAFYRAEMPNPWPSFQAPAEAPMVLPFPAPPVRRALWTSSRLALAASIAVLAGGVWLLSGAFSTDTAKERNFSHTDGTAGKALPLKGPFIDGEELKVIIDEPAGPGR